MQTHLSAKTGCKILILSISRSTFSGEKGSIEIRVTDGDYIPMRTHNWIMKTDRYVKKTIRGLRGGN